MAITPYITIAEALTILDQFVEMGSFSAASPTLQQQAINSATMAIDNLKFTGEKTSTTNEFPRDGESVVPDAILTAVAIEANALIEGKNSEVEWESEWMTSQTYAGVNSKYNRTSNQENIISGIMSILAWRLLKPYLSDYNEIRIDKV